MIGKYNEKRGGRSQEGGTPAPCVVCVWVEKRMCEEASRHGLSICVLPPDALPVFALYHGHDK